MGGFPPRGLNLGAPTVHYDHEEGYYYTIGGGSITAGPVRSKTLASGSWEISPLAPMAAPAAALRPLACSPPTQQCINVFSRMCGSWRPNRTPAPSPRLLITSVLGTTESRTQTCAVPTARHLATNCTQCLSKANPTM